GGRSLRGSDRRTAWSSTASSGPGPGARCGRWRRLPGRRRRRLRAQPRAMDRRRSNEGPLVISRFFIDRPIFANVIAIVTIIFGLVTMRALPVEQYPQITPPTVQVTTTYPGA